MTIPPDDEHWWDDSYRQDLAAPWDIGRPQPALVALAEQGLFVGRLLDAGCGTGEHALLAAEKGADALGIDLSETAISRARDKARSRGLNAEFEAGDILELSLPDAGFETVIDCGLFHVFDDDDRASYVATIGEALRNRGHCYLMCFSDRQPGDWGPRRIRRDEIENAFADGWTIDAIEPATFQINPMMGITTAAAWLASINREATPS